MKNRFSTVDIIAIINELQQYIGMRVNQVYDVDSKTYLIKLNRYEEKVTLLLESGIRIHTTDFDWPKNCFPSGFAMKLRKHIKNKRLEKLSQMGIDRVVDLQFGINEATYHLILELYDRGNLLLTDCDYCILNVLRPRTTNEDVKFVVREKYPVELAWQWNKNQFQSQLKEALNSAKTGDSLKKLLIPLTMYGTAMITHVLLRHNFSSNMHIGKDFDPATDMSRLLACLEEAEKLSSEFANEVCQGYVIQEEKINPVNQEKIINNLEFHPYLFQQYESSSYASYPSFDKAVDNFFSSMESQKIDAKVMQKEKEAMKKLANVKKDHENRLNKLLQEQQEDVVKASLIELNLDLVEKAILAIRSAVANQIPWSGIWDLIQEAQMEGDPVAKSIKKLKLEMNHFTILLGDPFTKADSDDDYNRAMEVKPQLVDIDLDLSAYGNARKYYDRKRHHAKKEHKTIEASERAFKNAEKRTKDTLKEAAVISTITKARKPMWFEKFIWFISSENYLVIAGRDIQQNEVIVKRYMKQGDVYVHADIHGASSVVVKNNSKMDIPPKTLNEAGSLSVCYSAAWDAKVLTSAWWVYHHQVSKTAPTGEYLSAGSFMIRGKKNYLMPSQLTLGFGFIFKLGDDESIQRHRDERRVRQELESLQSTEDGEVFVDIDNEASDHDNDGGMEDNNSKQNVHEMLSEAVQQLDIKENIEEEDELQRPEDNSYFPDTEIQLNVLTGGKESDTKRSFSYDSEDTLIIASSRKNNKKRADANDKQNSTNVCNSNEDKARSMSDQSHQPKRGQKGKLKKMKEKYKYQDDEERELRMKILGSAGEAKRNKKNAKQEKTTVAKESAKISSKETKVLEQPLDTVVEDDKSKDTVSSNVVEKTEDIVSSNVVEKTEDTISSNVVEKTVESDGEDEEVQTSDESDLLNTLTGCPLADDLILYAVPVCAPYSSLHSYKYKIKMMPGTSRRGKAAKTAVDVFLHDKEVTQREKDCLRSVKDQDISRNFPSGKIKLAYANMKRK